MSIKNTGLIFCATALLLSACAEPEARLPGERLDSRANPIVESTNSDIALRLPAPRINTSWTQRGGSASHTIYHPALANLPAPIWQSDIGQGESGKFRISAQPVVDNGRVYTLDPVGTVSAFNLAGTLLWRTQVKSDTHQGEGITGGGLAVRGNQLAVTTGAGDAALLDADSGTIRWTHRLNAAATAAPALSRNRMIVVTGDNVSYALDLQNGRIKWQQSSLGNSASVLGTGSPAISGAYAIVPYNSGEVQGITINNGLQAWSQILSGDRIGAAKNIFGALSGDPVIVGNRVYVASFAGRIAAFDRRSGLRIWTARDGAIGPIVPVDNSLFIVSDEYVLKRLSNVDGREIWQTPLPKYTNEKRQRGNIGHFGPLLAGGQLWVAGSDGELRAFDPQNGAQTHSITLRSGAATAPVVADGRMFVITQNGQLHAFQ